VTTVGTSLYTARLRVEANHSENKTEEYFSNKLASIALHPVLGERNSGRAKECYAFGLRKNMGREQKGGRRGVGKGKEGNGTVAERF